MYPPLSYLAYEHEEQLRVQQEVRHLMTTLGLTEREAQAYQAYQSGVPHLDAITHAIRFTEQVLEHRPRFTDTEVARLILMFYGFYDEEQGEKEDVDSDQQ